MNRMESFQCRPVEKKNVKDDFNKIELFLNSEEDIIKLEKELGKMIGPDGAAQCIFAMQVTMSNGGFVNQCQDATKALGKNLAERFGDEESFFDLVPSAEFSDVRSESFLDKAGYRGDYHSIGLVEMSAVNHEPAFLIIDLTYGHIAGEGRRGSILVINSLGTRDDAMNVLNEYYGGKWNVMFELDKNSGTFIFNEG